MELLKEHFPELLDFFSLWPRIIGSRIWSLPFAALIAYVLLKAIIRMSELIRIQRLMKGENLSAIEQKVFDGARDSETVSQLKILAMIEIKLFFPTLQALAKKSHEPGAWVLGTSKKYTEYFIKFMRDCAQDPMILFTDDRKSLFDFDPEISSIFANGHPSFRPLMLTGEKPSAKVLEWTKMILQNCANYTEGYAQQALANDDISKSIEHVSAENMSVERLAGMFQFFTGLTPGAKKLTIEAKVMLVSNDVHTWFMSKPLEERERLWDIALQHGAQLELQQTVEEAKEKAVKEQRKQTLDMEKLEKIDVCSTVEDLDRRLVEITSYSARLKFVKQQTWAYRLDEEVKKPNKSLPLTFKMKRKPIAGLSMVAAPVAAQDSEN